MTKSWAVTVCVIGVMSAGVRAEQTDVVTIDSGKIRGVVLGEKQDVHAFKGIPFAKPPVGELRWKAPEPPEPWDGVRECASFGNACPQRPPALMKSIPEMAINEPYSEDCLYLNVWAPADAKPGTLPVLYWIHGGGYVLGAASQPVYDGEALARMGCVVVSINYRLGALGFLAHPALSKESDQNISGNYGILDQIEGLRWVQRNIKTLGGDPQKVAIFGESAGGGSVMSLLAAPSAKGLFRGAIPQSSPEMDLAHLREAVGDRPSAEAEGVRITGLCGASEDADAEELRGLSVEKLLDVTPTLEVGKPGELRLMGIPLAMAPVVDGVVIPDDVNTMLAQGRTNQVPVIVGNTSEEMTLFLMFTRMPRDESSYLTALKDQFGDQAEAFARTYPASEPMAIRNAVIHLVSDIYFVSQARYTARQVARSGQKAFRYEFGRGSNKGMLKNLGAHHASELAYLFQQPAEPTETDEKIARALGQYWINFAATGDPNGEGLSEWPAYDRDEEPTAVFKDDVEIVNGHRTTELDLIDQVIRGAKASAGNAN